MNWWEALLIGFIQGISEFLPISSTAHLLLAKQIFAFDTPADSELVLEVFLHAASLLAVILYFARELLRIVKDFTLYLLYKHEKHYNHYRFGCLLLLTTFVTMVAGKGLESILGEQLTTVALIGASLIITGIFLVLIEHGVDRGKRKELTWRDGVLIGLGQALAVIPGISRSGSTLIAALWCGLSKEVALRYSFLLSIPIILGISILKLPELTQGSYSNQWPSLLIAFLSSFFFALLSIKWLIAMVQNSKLTYFACYCIGLGLFSWIFLA
ncbi:undecaprenyl-diphosphate phosphatase [Alkalihalobacillus oceani]|uniref:undecaprenyl-diphosphate phosphatase n=1 Tax=Halalkalibacter oceani TaxID=1653776 RepID=UPI00203E404D|nr:undecaprenyl-diphosphate phosphatase [Halalkalibacter oceani]MCM3761669.1 undecaprenyl-diphosphate phosphatase [Halalkalibacter oceani]